MKTKASIVKDNWKGVREEIRRLHPQLVTIIDQINPPDDFLIWRVRYPFGEKILHDGGLMIPNENGKMVSIADPSLSQEIKDSLFYRPDMPLGVVLNKSIELYVMLKGQVVPRRLMKKGRIFALWSVLQPTGTTSEKGRMWNIISGTRSLISASKISDAIGYGRVQKELGVKELVMPKNLQDHWFFFKQLFDSGALETDWHSEVLFFSKKWLDALQTDSAWLALKAYFLDVASNDTSFLRDQLVFDLTFSMALMDKNLKPNPYLSDTVKHIYMMAREANPGFVIATDDSAAPISHFQQILDEVYKLKFMPTLFHSGYLEKNTTHSVYYSLETPTLLAFSPKSKDISNKLGDLREICHIQRTFERYLKEDKQGLAGTPIHGMGNEIQFDYWHNEDDRLSEVKNASDLVKLDETLKKQLKAYPDKPFCHTSPFLRGCVRLSNKKEPRSN